MKKNIFLLCLFLVISSFCLPRPAYAHFAATDGTITGVFHVDPNDDPIPGQPSYLYFLLNFNDKTKKFDLAQCKCTVTIYEQGKQIFQQQLIKKGNSHTTVWGADMPFVFQKRDVYAIALKGEPLQPNVFKPFFLTWSFRVAEYPQPSQPTQEQSDPTFAYFVIGFFGIFVVTGITLFLVKRL